MKRVWTLFLMVVMLLNVCVPVYAADPVPVEGITVSTEIEYLDNGDYIETVITEIPVAEAAAASASVNATAQQKSGTKKTTYYNSAGEAMCSVSVKAIFTYTPGVSVTCSIASASAASYSSSWKVGTPTASYSGNKATGTVTATHYWAFIPASKTTLSVTLSCDVNGNLS